jgi:hypothetical protein
MGAPTPRLVLLGLSPSTSRAANSGKARRWPWDSRRFVDLPWSGVVKSWHEHSRVGRRVSIRLRWRAVAPTIGRG